MGGGETLTAYVVVWRDRYAVYVNSIEVRRQIKTLKAYPNRRLMTAVRHDHPIYRQGSTIQMNSR